MQDLKIKEKDDDEPRGPTSLKIRPSVWREFKVAAIRKDMDATELLELVMVRYLNRAEGKEVRFSTDGKEASRQ